MTCSVFNFRFSSRNCRNSYMIFSSLCPFRGIGSPLPSAQRTTPLPNHQLSLCLIVGSWVITAVMSWRETARGHSVMLPGAGAP